MDYLTKHQHYVDTYILKQAAISQLQRDLQDIQREDFILRQDASMLGIDIPPSPYIPEKYQSNTIGDFIKDILANALEFPGMQRATIHREVTLRRGKATNGNTVSMELTKLKKQGIIESPAFGFYRLVKPKNENPFI